MAASEGAQAGPTRPDKRVPCREQRDVYRCSLPRGHPGGHVARGLDRVLDAWPAAARPAGDDTAPPAEPAPIVGYILARRILTGARCTHCSGLVALSDSGAVAYVSDVPGAGGHFVDGSTWTAEQARAAGQCRWRRAGRRWVRGCEDTRPDQPRPSGPNRAERRRRKGGSR